jgi:putative N6-adenine-specific DNA methylase
MSPALEKRIKRHVIGREHRCFAAAAPGLEPLCLGELAALGLTGAATEGGVEFSGRLEDLYRANLMLRTAGRLLMRIHTFRASTFAALENAAAAVPWELFVLPAAVLRFRVTTRHCRLHHTGAIAERLAAAAAEHLSKAPAGQPPADGPPPSQIVFVRGVDDRFTVSLDSSGENLYRRGIKTHGGPAPLRETLAAAALLLAGYAGEESLVDPMCGAGTFALEAALMAAHRPPGAAREFGFMGWPSFRPRRWEFLKNRALGGTRVLETPRIFASDSDPTACERLAASVARHDLAHAVSVACRDFFEFDPQKLGTAPGLVTLNPPYGRRLAGRSPGRMRDLVAVLTERYHGWKVLLLAPHTTRLRHLPFPAQVHRLVHGGLAIDLICGRIP